MKITPSLKHLLLALLIVVASCKQDDTILTGDTSLNDDSITKSTDQVKKLWNFSVMQK